MKSLVLVAIFSVLASLFHESLGQCKTADELDDCAYKSAFLINRNIKIPSTVPELQSFCGTARDSIACMTDFNDNCVTGPPQIFLRKIYGTVKKGLEDRCTDSDKSSEFVENMKCLDTDVKVESVRMCSDKHVKLLEKVAELEFGQRTGPLCCAFQAFKKCTIDAVNTACGQDQANYFLSIIMEYTDELATVTCNQFSTVEKCAVNLKPDVWAAFKPIIETSEKINHNYKTSVPIMYRMIEKFIKKSK